MNKLAPYFQRPGMGEDVLDNWPNLEAALFMDIGPDFAARLRSKYPNLKICLRLYEGDVGGWANIHPQDWALRFAPVHPDFAISWTMPLGHDNVDQFAAFDDWSVQFAQASRELGIEPIGLCVGTGNFTAAPDRIKVSEAFPGICQTYNILGPQDYGWPTLQNQVNYHALRWKAWHDDIKDAFGREMKFMPMECGLTQMVLEDHPDLGWQSGADGVTDESYIATMRWYNERLCELDYVTRAYVYLFHGYSDWETFNHIKRPNVWHVIRDFDATGTEPPPEEPPSQEEPPMTDTLEGIRVFKWDKDAEKHIELTALADKEALVYGKYGAAFRRAEVSAGAKVYRLTELWEKTGHSALITQVLNEDGQPMANVDVALYWPGAPDPPEPDTQVYDHDWHRNFVHGPTNVNGDVGPGMGKGAYHGEGEGGPHAVWVRDPDVPSDICEKLGMLAGTFHDHLDQKFQLMTAGAGPSGGNGSNGDGAFVKQSEEWEPGPHNYIRIVSLNHGLYDMGGNLKSGDWEIPDLVSPGVFDGLPGIQFDTTYTEPVDRTYAASIVYLPTGEVVGGPWPCTFHAGETGTWLLTVKWSGDGGNGGGEEPPSGSKAEAYHLIAEGHEDIATGHDKIAAGYYILKGL